MKHLCLLAGAILSLVLWQQSASADLINGGGPTSGSDGAIVVNAGWYGFCFGGNGSAAFAGCQNEGIGVSGNPTSFTASGSVDFNVTDAFLRGDTFEVIVNGVPFFTDAVPVAGGPDISDPNLAFADPTYSHISIPLGPGSYTVDIFADLSPYGGGGAYLEAVSAAVPEPSTLVLLIAALAGFGLLHRRRTLREQIPNLVRPTPSHIVSVAA